MVLSEQDKKRIEEEERYRAKVKADLAKENITHTNEIITNNGSMTLTYNNIYAWILSLLGYIAIIIGVFFGLVTLWMITNPSSGVTKICILFCIIWAGLIITNGFISINIGNGLRDLKNYARNCLLASSVILLFGFPIGTIWGVWNFYYYLRQDIASKFVKEENASAGWGLAIIWCGTSLILCAFMFFFLVALQG